MKLKNIIFILIISMVVSVAVSAQEETAVDECENAMDTATMNMCAARDLEVADEKLNEVYKELVVKFEQSEAKGIKKKLVEAQRAWIMFRDAECELYAFSSSGGSIHTLQLSGCLLDETEKRTAVLQNYLEKWPEM